MDITSTAPRSRQRLTWLDFFRGLAVLVMIETHVVNTFLAPSLTGNAWFPLLNYINGLVAPSFLFIAGFVQGMERRNRPGKPIKYARRARRLLGIAALGYALHFPIGEVLQSRWADAWRVGSQVDVLQCLAFGLGLVLGVTWLVERCDARSRNWAWSLGIAALAAVAIVGAPSAQGWVDGPVALRAWVNGTTGSLFPLFPWIGFVFLGALMGACPQRPVPQRIAGLASLAVLAWACRGDVFSAASPSFFLERAVWVLALAALCEWNAQRVFPSLAVYAGTHSLKFYVVHLVLITALAGMGMPTGISGWPAVLGLFALVGTATFGVAWILERWPLFLRPGRAKDQPRIPASEDLPSAAT